MIYSNILNLDRFFFEVRKQLYVIIKIGDFPNYCKGGDIDVFCYNKNEFARLILGVGNFYIDHGFEIEVANKEKEDHAYIDFYLNGELDLRFDLHRSLPKYKKIRLKEHYLYSVIDNRSSLCREFNGVEYPVYIPSEVDDLLLRYIEYIEWYEQRPDKIGHLEYIFNAISSDENRMHFIDKLHVYTELPAQDNELETRKAKRYIGIIKYIRRMATFSKRKLTGVIPKSIPLRKVLRRTRCLTKFWMMV